jgi:release factor glutamine methyltransferase
MTDSTLPGDVPADLSPESPTTAPGLPLHEQLRLVAAVTGRKVAEVTTGTDLTPAQQHQFEALAARRLNGQPLQYLEGTVQFGPVELAVDERVLIPRPETEYLFELHSVLSPAPGLIVDLCTGSGALALALKRTYPSARVIGTDRSDAVLELAAANGVANDLSVDWLQGDLYEALPAELAGEVDLLLANPPYIAEGDWSGLPEDVQREPRRALIAGPTGMEIAERIVSEVRRWLAPSGEAWVEVGSDQAQNLADRFSAQVVTDQYGRDRFVRISVS